MTFEKYLVNRDADQNVSNAFDYHNRSRFRWYGYKEGFSPKLVEEAIDATNFKKDDIILDPFNGNGTVTLTASLNNIKAVGIEVNPFVAFMSKAKLSDVKATKFEKGINPVLLSSKKGSQSNLLKFSTFSEFSGREKWLFNSSVLNSFEGGWRSTNDLSKNSRELYRLALIGAALDNCNATKDGKCLKYRERWHEKAYNKASFLESLENRLMLIQEDLAESSIDQKALIINGDSRNEIKNIPNKFKLCITSPPYLNSFDYTDIYRPELFLGKFIANNQQLHKLRYKTIRSHVEIKLPPPILNSFGDVFKSVFETIRDSNVLWDKQIPIMIQSYFEDMEIILKSLLKKAKKEAELWLVVANSIYVGTELPVDLILAEIGTRAGWKLKRIEVVRNIQRRKTKHDGNLKSIRESLIVFQKIS